MLNDGPNVCKIRISDPGGVKIICGEENNGEVDVSREGERKWLHDRPFPKRTRTAG